MASNGPEILQGWDSKFQGRYFALQQHPGVPLPDESEKQFKKCKQNLLFIRAV